MTETALRELIDALKDCASYLEERSDVIDGDEVSGPRPNREMTLLSVVNGALQNAGEEV